MYIVSIYSYHKIHNQVLLKQSNRKQRKVKEKGIAIKLARDNSFQNDSYNSTTDVTAENEESGGVLRSTTQDAIVNSSDTSRKSSLKLKISPKKEEATGSKA